MALILRDIYQSTRQRFQLQLLAGEAGLRNSMRWVYVSEDDTTSDFLHGGELIITTGVISGGRSDWLLHLLQGITRQHACGLIVNEGPYLSREQISQEVLDFCNEQAFPLFVMPWHIHIYDITRDYCDRIFTDTRHNEAIYQALMTVLNRAADHGPSLCLLAEQGFPTQSAYYAVHMQVQPDVQIDPAIRDWIYVLSEFPFPAFALVQNQTFTLVCRSDDAQAVQDVAALVQAQLCSRFPGRTVTAGIGGQIANLDDLAKSLEQAQAALCWGHSQQLSLACYDDMGFFRLLLEVHDRDFLERYVQEQLGAVLDYDAQHESDFLQTLRLYLIYRGSIQAIAAHSFFHRNTISHRISILRDKLGYALDDPMTCFHLLTAFQIREFLQTYMTAH